MDISAKDLRAAYQTARRDPSIKTPDQYPSSGISIGACKKPPNLGVKVQLHDLVNYILRKGGWDKVRDKCLQIESTSAEQVCKSCSTGGVSLC